MSYSTDPVSDAAEHYDALFDRNEAIDATEAQVRDEIISAFTVTLLKHPAKALAVPSVDFRSRQPLPREVAVSVAEAIADTVQGGYVDDEMVAVLEKSTCPHVQALRMAIAQSWAKHNAGDVAQARVDQ